MKINLYAIFIFLLITTSCSASQAKEPSVQRDIIYCTMDGVDLKMDVYTPNLLGKMPAVIYIHGGGWTKGDKTLLVGKDAPALNESGIVVFAIDYRLGDEYKFPAMIEDVKCAARFIRAHADEYNVDPNHIGAYGMSAGGHLAALLAAADESAGFDVGEHLEYSSRIQAVVDMFGPADLTLIETIQLRKAFREKDFARASPVNYVSTDDPPFLIFHGDEDHVVPLEQSQILYEKLIESGVPAELIVVENGGHGFSSSSKLNPAREEITQLIADFFVKTLK